MLTAASLVAWLWLVFNGGWFWRTGQRLEFSAVDDPKDRWPSVSVIVPARNEADLLPTTLPMLLNQKYPGDFHVSLVDDGSGDGTADAARQAASNVGQSGRLTVVTSEPLPSSWAGKLWALEQGVRISASTDSEYILVRRHALERAGV